MSAGCRAELLGDNGCWGLAQLFRNFRSPSPSKRGIATVYRLNWPCISQMQIGIHLPHQDGLFPLSTRMARREKRRRLGTIPATPAQSSPIPRSRQSFQRAQPRLPVLRPMAGLKHGSRSSPALSSSSTRGASCCLPGRVRVLSSGPSNRGIGLACGFMSSVHQVRVQFVGQVLIGHD